MKDMMWNGRLCKSGLARMTAANTGACATLSAVQFKGANITAPY